MRRYLTLPLLLLLTVSLVVPAGGSVEAQNAAPEVFVADLGRTTGEGDELTGRTVRYVERVISDAREQDAAAVAMELSTSGGRLDLTQDIVETMSNADDVAVIVYVAPQGAQAASAGTFILMGSDVAAMAPQTRTGAATPVSFFGGDLPSTLSQKARNDAAAFITSLAEAHGRNEAWAESAVREAAAVSAQEALETGVVEHVEPDLRSVVRAADGTTVEPKGITLDTADAVLVAQGLNFGERFGFSRWFVIVPVALLVLGGVGFAVAAWRTSRPTSSTGLEGMVGKIGEVRQTVGKGGGTVFVHGELWSALPENAGMAPIEPGTEVEIVGFRRTSVVVRPAQEG